MIAPAVPGIGTPQRRCDGIAVRTRWYHASDQFAIEHSHVVLADQLPEFIVDNSGRRRRNPSKMQDLWRVLYRRDTPRGPAWLIASTHTARSSAEAAFCFHVSHLENPMNATTKKMTDAQQKLYDRIKSRGSDGHVLVGVEHRVARSLRANGQVDIEEIALDGKNVKRAVMVASETTSDQTHADAPKKPRGKRPDSTPKDANGAKLGCLDAAYRVLVDAGYPMDCKTMIAKMAERNLWTSPAKTPDRTLYSAILREINKKADDARFEKAEPGKFAARKVA